MRTVASMIIDDLPQSFPPIKYSVMFGSGTCKPDGCYLEKCVTENAVDKVCAQILGQLYRYADPFWTSKSFPSHLQISFGLFTDQRPPNLDSDAQFPLRQDRTGFDHSSAFPYSRRRGKAQVVQSH